MHTKHAATDKFDILEKHKFKIDRDFVKKVIEKPDQQ